MKATLDLTQIDDGKIILTEVNPVTLIAELKTAFGNDPALASAFDTVSHLIGASNGGTATNRSNHSWNATPERRFFKCVLGVLVRQGLARNELLLKFHQLVPDLQTLFDFPVTDSAIWGRADTGRRARYHSEWPGVNPLTAPYWSLAQQVVAEDKPLTADEVRALVASVNQQVVEPPSPQQEAPEAAAEDPFGPPCEEKTTVGSPSDAPEPTPPEHEAAAAE
jgi:hypothetical protein